MFDYLPVCKDGTYASAEEEASDMAWTSSVIARCELELHEQGHVPLSTHEVNLLQEIALCATLIMENGPSKAPVQAKILLRDLLVLKQFRGQ